jgi:glycerol uptake facilitator-like aquaporin
MDVMMTTFGSGAVAVNNLTVANTSRKKKHKQKERSDRCGWLLIDFCVAVTVVVLILCVAKVAVLAEDGDSLVQPGIAWYSVRMYG